MWKLNVKFKIFAQYCGIGSSVWNYCTKQNICDIYIIFGRIWLNIVRKLLLLQFIPAAIYVSGQELKISLPEGNDACARREVTLTCTIRGSPNLTSLILAWSSPEYIGNPLRFVSVDTPGMIATSMINGNVTAVLTNNTRIGGVPVLVSELHIVDANQRSMITCESVTNESSASTVISIPGTYYMHYYTMHIILSKISLNLCLSGWYMNIG